MFVLKQKIKIWVLIVISILSLVATLHAHENRPHHDGVAEVKADEENGNEKLQNINIEYLRDIKPIFQKSCVDCHGSTTRYPWYSKLPFAKQVIEKDVRESKEHLDLSNDFPFGGHGTPTEDLVAIDKSVEEGTMPPFRYWILHPSSKLNTRDKAKIKAWVEKSLLLLSKNP